MKLAVTETLDVLGLLCPEPIIRTAKRVRTMKPGEVLEVLSDDPVSDLDMRAWCHSFGHEYLGCEDQSGRFHLFVKVSDKRKSGG